MVDANAGRRDGARRKGFTSQNLAPRVLPWSLFRGLGKTVEEPTRSNSVGSQPLSSLPQLAVGSDQGDSIGRALDDLNEHVVTATGRVENRHLAHDAGLGAIACFTFEDHDDRFGDTSRTDGCAHLVHEFVSQHQLGPSTSLSGETPPHLLHRSGAPVQSDRSRQPPRPLVQITFPINHPIGWLSALMPSLKVTLCPNPSGSRWLMTT